MTDDATTPLLSMEHVDFAYGRGAAVLHDVSLSLEPGQSLGLVGESGAGKTSVLRLLLGLAEPTGGRVLFRGEPVTRRGAERLRELRRTVQPVYQDPFSSLDPRMTVGASIAEPLRSLRITRERPVIAERVAELLEAVDLPADAAGRYPEAFSGGQRQRIAIARALAPRPRLLLADEPVSALDTSVRMHVIELLQRLAAEQGVGMLLVSHDLTIVSALCAQMTVLRDGCVIETGPTARLLTDPQQDYTARLVASVPRLPAR